MDSNNKLCMKEETKSKTATAGLSKRNVGVQKDEKCSSNSNRLTLTPEQKARAAMNRKRALELLESKKTSAVLVEHSTQPSPLPVKKKLFVGNPYLKHKNPYAKHKRENAVTPVCRNTTKPTDGNVVPPVHRDNIKVVNEKVVTPIIRNSTKEQLTSPILDNANKQTKENVVTPVRRNAAKSSNENSIAPILRNSMKLESEQLVAPIAINANTNVNEKVFPVFLKASIMKSMNSVKFADPSNEFDDECWEREALEHMKALEEAACLSSKNFKPPCIPSREMKGLKAVSRGQRYNGHGIKMEKFDQQLDIGRIEANLARLKCDCGFYDCNCEWGDV